MRLSNIILGTAVCCILTPLSAVQAEYKIATVDINKIINESKESKALKKSIDEKAMAARKKIEAKRLALKTTEEDIKSGKVKEDSKEADKFRSDAREFNRFVKDTEEDLRKEFMKSNKVLTDKAVGVIKTYAAKNHVDLVLDKSEEMRGPVLYGESTADITDEVLKTIN